MSLYVTYPDDGIAGAKVLLLVTQEDIDLLLATPSHQRLVMARKISRSKIWSETGRPRRILYGVPLPVELQPVSVPTLAGSRIGVWTRESV